MPRSGRKKVSVKAVKSSIKKAAKRIVGAARRDPRARSLVKGGLRRLGTAAGTMLGGPAGGMIGMQTGDFISRITGFGDYKVNRNTVIQGNSVPTFRSGGDGMVVCHREFISDVLGSTDFSVRTFAINPGLSATFPLLAQLSQTFEEYELRGLVFEYRPSSGSAVSSTSSALGVVVLATNYDSADPLFTSKQEMESYEFSTSTVPFAGCIHPVECARRRNVLDSLYVRTGTPPGGTDIRLYDMGNFQIASQGMQSVYVVGELWASYDCVLRKPRLLSGIGPLVPSNWWHATNIQGSITSNLLLFGSQAPAITPGSNTSLAFVATLGNYKQVVLPVSGQYLVLFTNSQNVSGTNGLSFNPGFGQNINYGDQIVSAGSGSSFPIGNDVNSPANALFASLVVTAPGSGADNVIYCYQGSSAGSTTVMDVLVVRIGDLTSRVMSQLCRKFSAASVSSWDEKFD